jgi:hypothetical protein
MKTKKEEEESDDAKFCSLMVPTDHEDKESKTYMFKIKTYDSGTPEEFWKWRLALNEQVNNNGYDMNYDNFMEAFLMRNAHQKQRIESARPRLKLNISPVKFMTLPFLNCQFVLLKSKVDG